MNVSADTVGNELFFLFSFISHILCKKYVMLRNILVLWHLSPPLKHLQLQPGNFLTFKFDINL